MLHFPAFCIDNFYKDPDAIREYALSLKFNTIGVCQGRRTAPLDEINSEFDSVFSKQLLSVFYDMGMNDVKWVIKSYFHLHRMTDNSGFENNTEETCHVAHKYRDFEPSYVPEVPTAVHLDDKCFFSGVIYLNPIAEPHAGSAIYKVVESTNPIRHGNGDIEKEIVVETVNFKQVYNRLVAFDGKSYHGRTGANKQSERLTHVFFAQYIGANIPTPLNRFRVL
jgi:hypothetical protein